MPNRPAAPDSSSDAPSPSADKTDEQWREQLTDDQYRVTRQGGTEPPFSGRYYRHREAGRYRCICCGNYLFSSRQKYDSGSGWPSFTSAWSDAHVSEQTDHTHGMVRTEVRCARCDAHLGHKFPDGPPPTGQRYCINSLALDFESDDTPDGDSPDFESDDTPDGDGPGA